MPPFFIAEKKWAKRRKELRKRLKTECFLYFLPQKKLYKFDISFKMVVSD